jgi:cobalt-zinc-cadmium efflux system outer membrane protein
MAQQLKFNLLSILLILAAAETGAQPDTTVKQTDISYALFLTKVSQGNLAYAAEKFNINLARAGVEAAKVFPDPVISLGANDNGQKRMKMGYGINTGMSWVMELGGKRKARYKVADSQLQQADLLLNDYFRNLRATATQAYLQAILQRQLLQISMESYTSLAKLAAFDSLRFKLGQIAEINARQSKIEAGMMLNKVYQQQSSLQESLIGLRMLMGNRSDTLFTPDSSALIFDRHFDLRQLISDATSNRSDVLAAQKNIDIARNRVELAKANRIMDLGLNVGLTGNSVVTNQVSPTPSTTVVSAGISMPLKLSNKYKGELMMANYAQLQSETWYEQAKLNVQSQITTAYQQYLSAGRQVFQFRSGLLEQAKKSLDGKIYSYERGETTLLEVLNAQRTYNEVQENYSRTLNAYGVSLVELERATGIWDINL